MHLCTYRNRPLISEMLLHLNRYENQFYYHNGTFFILIFLNTDVDKKNINITKSPLSYYSIINTSLIQHFICLFVVKEIFVRDVKRNKLSKYS